MNELEALVILGGIPHLGSIKIRTLINHYGSARKALEASIEEIAALPGFGPKILQGWALWKENLWWQHELKEVERLEINLIPYTSTLYPKRLKEIHDAPLLLYVKGSCDLQERPCIAVVGTRQPTIYGKEMAEQIARELSACGFIVISGLARGIDTAAHQGAVKNDKPTFAVIGSGLANVYPRENISLAQEISKNGALISEFPLFTPPDRQNFPQRNRIVSGMSTALILIEGGIESGGMITMEKALAQGDRRLFTLPGRADIENFRGNHLLIKQGKAQLVENAQEIIQNLHQLFDFFPKNISFLSNKVQLDYNEVEFLKSMPSEELSFDHLILLTQLPTSELNVLLMRLIMKKAIREYPGKIYKKIMVPSKESYG
jgi:DNA processing protein